MIAKVVMVSMLPLLAGCGRAISVQNLETGEIVQCENEPWWFGTESWAFRTVGQIIANNECAEVYERHAWRTLN
jgi:hypothetical protein